MSAVAKEKELYSGKVSGLTFEAFDEKVITWCRKKYGDTYANGLWKNELDDIINLDLSDEEDNFVFELQCAKVYDILCRTSVKNADWLHAKSSFWTKKYQVEFRQMCWEQLFCYLEELCTGEAARQLRKLGVRKMVTMRDFLFRRFGAGQPELIQERVRIYLLGMPDHNMAAFPPRCNMEEKLDALEAEREYLIEMCPKDKRDAYQDGKEETLIRIILNHLPAEYDAAVKSVRDLSRLRKYGEEGDIHQITNLEDNSRLNYSADWLPNYLELRAELINAYQLAKRRRDETGRSEKKKVGHPTMPILDGFAQPGATAGPCYRCGEKDHRATDPLCRGKEGDFSKDAPEWFKRKAGFGSGNGKGKGKGKAKGKGKGRAGGNRNWKGKGDSGKPPCANWSKGNGYCKWGDNCRFAHDGPKGGKRKASASLATKGSVKKQKKQMMSMLVKVLDDVDEKKSEPKERQPSTKDRLMQLVRGNGTLVGMVTSADSDRNYVPSRPKPAGRTVLMIGGSAREKREYRPVDPRRLQRSRAESSAVQSEADTKQSQNEKVID